LNFRAAWLLNRFGVDLLLFLPHFTRAGQPIDIATGSPTKAALSDQIAKRIGSMAVLDKTDRGNESRIRQTTIDALSSAMQRGCSPENIAAGFRTTGLIPGDREALLTSVRRFLSDGTHWSLLCRRLPALAGLSRRWGVGSPAGGRMLNAAASPRWRMVQLHAARRISSPIEFKRTVVPSHDITKNKLKNRVPDWARVDRS
jgi:hypothetical protein